MSILLIEDEPSKEKNIVTFLGELLPDVKVDIKRSITSGKIEIRKKNYDHILLDMSLPLFDNDDMNYMDENEFALIRALMARNEDMRVIAVGDDDQNIYQFRGSDSGYMRRLIEDYGAVKYEMTENYRSRADLVRFSNTIPIYFSFKVFHSSKFKPSNPIISV